MSNLRRYFDTTGDYNFQLGGGECAVNFNGNVQHYASHEGFWRAGMHIAVDFLVY